MAKKQLSEQVKTLHKKLMPANIIIAVVALVAALCTLFMPWFDLRITIKGEGLSSMLTSGSSSSITAQLDGDGLVFTNASDDSATSEGGGGMGDLDMGSILATALKDVTIELPINLYPMKMLKAATGDKADFSEFIVSVIGKDGAVEEISNMVNELVPTVLKGTVTAVVDKTVDEAIANLGSELTDSQIQQIETVKDDVTDIIDALMGTGDTPPNKELASQKFTEMVNDMAAITGEEIDIPQEEIDKVFETLVDHGTNPETGKFDILHLMGNIENMEGMGNMDGSSSSDGDSSIQPTAFAFAATQSNESDSNSSSGSEESDELDILDLLQNPAKAIEDTLLKEADISEIQPVLLGMVIVFSLLPAAVWFLLAIRATIRIFTEKKKVRMGWAKFFGFWAAFFMVIFNFGFSAATSALPAEALGEVSAILNSFSMKFLGAPVVGAICWAILVLLGWFYYKPIKRKIKKQLKRERKALKNGMPLLETANDAPVENLPVVENMPVETEENNE